MKTQSLIQQMDGIKTERSSVSKRMRKTRLSFQLNRSKDKYISFTNMSKTQQFNDVYHRKKQRKSEWKHDYYRTRDCFSKFQQEKIEQFPDNNKKYNVQFLVKNLQGQGLKMPIKDLGLFPRTKKSLYSQHYQPIYDSIIKHNEDYELRTSLFGDTWVDIKKQRILDLYKLQANPFKTQRSNNLLSRLKKGN